MTTNRMTEEERESREDARQFILDGIDSGADPVDILNELSSFYDGDIVDLF